MSRYQELNIIAFIEHPQLLNDQSLSAPQITILKSVYGMELTEGELIIYRRGTGHEIYDAKPCEEATLIIGRRGGKTTLAVYIVIYEAIRDHGLPEGEEGYIVIIAKDLKQARRVFRIIREKFRRSPVLSKLVKKVTRDEIVLHTNVVISCFPPNHESVRGRNLIAVIADELAFWSQDEWAASPAEEVLAALRPGMATVRDTKLLKISTPYGKIGIIWQEFTRRAELDFPVWQLPSIEMNPTLRGERLEREQHRDETKYRREYLAEFTDSVTNWIPPEFIDHCIVRGRAELPPRQGVRYVAALDAATRGSDFAFAIVHKTPDDGVVVDYVQTWTPSKTKDTPLLIEPILCQIRGVLDRYGTNHIIGDQFYSDAIRQQFLKIQIICDKFEFTAASRSGLFTNLRDLLTERKLELLDDPKLIGQLRNLRQEQRPSGYVDVRPVGGKDDSAVVVALAVKIALNEVRRLSVEAVSADLRGFPQPLRFDPYSCPVAAICKNHPDCFEPYECRGFVDKRLVTIEPCITML
jgi:hypothetical protein